MIYYDRTIKYILDFDGVLFDTEALKQKLKEQKVSQLYRDVSSLQKIEDNSFTLKSLVFPDAFDFLREHGKDCVIVSSASSICASYNTNLEKQREFQYKKIKLSGVDTLVQDVYIVNEDKRDILKKLQEVYTGHLIFLDDRQTYIQQALSVGIEGVLLQRESQSQYPEQDSLGNWYEYNTVKNFLEFKEYIRYAK